VTVADVDIADDPPVLVLFLPDNANRLFVDGRCQRFPRLRSECLAALRRVDAEQPNLMPGLF